MRDYLNQKLERQQEEISTIKERIFKLKLSDADCERISKLAGKSGLTIGELLENFIGDLVDGTFSNGSDERDRADQWYERCWFSHRFDGEEDSELLGFMLNWGYDIDDFLTAVDEKEYFENNPQELAEEVVDLEEEEKLWFIGVIDEVINPYLEKNPDADIKVEIEKCRIWFNDTNNLLNQTSGQEEGN